MISVSRKCLRLLSVASESKWPKVMSSRTKFWGHNTLEEKEAIEKQEKELRVVKWPGQGGSALANKDFVLTPARMKDEADAMGEKKNPFMSVSDYYSYASRPWFPAITDTPYWAWSKLKTVHQQLIDGQVFVRERFTTLGPDLAAAHFLIQRNCRVRFVGHEHWTELNLKTGAIDLPGCYEPGYYIEAIDCAESILVYEGFNNLRNLIHLRYLDLSDCCYVDEFVLDRITSEYADSLEYIDLSGCMDLNWSGLECLWRLKKLKTLVLYDMDHVQDLGLICIMLLEIFPNLDIRGVDYIDEKLLIGTEHEHLLDDLEEILLLDEDLTEMRKTY